uniref:Uncharacterized protein LOC102809297 n=1 Tax=Saccoglossus kowalevskii TaxID=10224 RepID=A0ABM0M7R1_SACKO|nr:PREDICTED: uncharacterized protein LOC102809297 [Saccoglossus kowalevskii]
MVITVEMRTMFLFRQALRICLDVVMVMFGTLVICEALAACYLVQTIYNGEPADLIFDPKSPPAHTSESRLNNFSTATSSENRYSEDPLADSNEGAPPRTLAHVNPAFSATITAEDKANKRKPRSSQQPRHTEPTARPNKNRNQDKVEIEQLDHPPRVITPTRIRSSNDHEAAVQMMETPVTSRENVVILNQQSPYTQYGHESDDDPRYVTEPCRTGLSTPSLAPASPWASSIHLQSDDSGAPKVHRYDDVASEPESAHMYEEVPLQLEPRQDSLFDSETKSYTNPHMVLNDEISNPDQRYANSDENDNRAVVHTPCPQSPDLYRGPSDEPVFIVNDAADNSHDKYNPHARHLQKAARSNKMKPKPYSGEDERFTEGSIRKSLEKLYGKPEEAHLGVIGRDNQPIQMANMNEPHSLLADGTHHNGSEDGFPGTDTQNDWENHLRRNPSPVESIDTSISETSSDSTSLSKGHTYHPEQEDHSIPTTRGYETDPNNYQRTLPDDEMVIPDWNFANGQTRSTDRMDEPCSHRAQPWSGSNHGIFGNPNSSYRAGVPVNEATMHGDMALPDFATERPTRQSKSTSSIDSDGRLPATTSGYYHNMYRSSDRV